MSQTVTYRCEKENYLGTNTLSSKGTFKCEVCGQQMWLDTKTLELSAHGLSAKSLKHVLLQLKGVGVEK